MSPQLVTILTLISGISWTLVYVDLIYRGFRDKTYGMPLFALAFNFAWEFLFAFVFNGGERSLQALVNTIWCVFDAIILYTYFRYGRKEFPKTAEARWFLPWSVTAFAVGFDTIYFSVVEFGVSPAARYTAFGQNLMMSALFIGMLVGRNDVRGQSMPIAILKGIGTLAPTIQFTAQTGSALILAFGIGCFVFDVVYAALLYQKFRELGLNPFTRRPVIA